MKTFFVLLSIFPLTLTACSSSQSSQEPKAAAFDTSAEQRFRATGTPDTTSSVNCSWSQPYKTDSRLREGMRFTQRGTSPTASATMQTTIVSIANQSIVSDVLFTNVKGSAPGLKDGMKFRQTCTAATTSSECSISPQMPASTMSQESCYVRSDTADTADTSITYTEGTFTMADGREIPAELERRSIKGTLVCSGREGVKAEENAITISSKVIPDPTLTHCEGTTSIYTFREVRDTNGNRIEGDQSEMIEAP